MNHKPRILELAYEHHPDQGLIFDQQYGLLVTLHFHSSWR
ncbi:hypothetical protein Rumeso_03698 [Rubellimicrobium mesophilum DSM 19309]|uniref:Uncharacterized protein n=1 Tax=Rubellimicrobium mesophilum DSM 19309 TaxID=442562 RepID=A0A017HK85_9RHOB|nr:hypothetical protein Rumeso_03698 [Rubellimicrobium mesophilum DSM 19309]